MFRKLLSQLYFAFRLPGGLGYIREASRLFNGPRDVLLAYQEDKYLKLIRYAYEHTVYYRRVFDEIGLFQNGELQRDRLKDIPVLTKETLKKNQSDLISDEMQGRKPYFAATSGSTGIPLKVWYDQYYKSRNRADKMFMGILNGRDMGQPELKMWFRDFDLYQENGKDKDRFFYFFNNRTFCLASVISEDSLKNYIDRINTVKPVQIWSTPAPIYEVSKYIIKQGIKIHCPRDIILTSSALYDEMRKTMEQAFPGTYIVNQYGATEFGVIACSVKDARPMRIFEHSVKVEVMTEDRGIQDSGEGDMVVTGLNNYSMPLIRYLTGDMGTILPFDGSMGGSFKAIETITGRSLSMLRKPDGSYISGLFLRDLLTKPWIRTFQLIQHSYEDTEALLVIDGTPEEHKEELAEVSAKLKEALGVECRFTLCDDIAVEKNGKYFYVKSEIE